MNASAIRFLTQFNVIPTNKIRNRDEDREQQYIYSSCLVQLMSQQSSHIFIHTHTLTRILNTVAFNLRTNDLILPYFIEITFFFKIVCSLKNLLCGMEMLFMKCDSRCFFLSLSLSRRLVCTIQLPTTSTILRFVLAKFIEQ